MNKNLQVRMLCPLNTSGVPQGLWHHGSQWSRTQLPTDLFCSQGSQQIFQMKGPAVTNAPMSNINSVTRCQKQVCLQTIICSIISVLILYITTFLMDCYQNIITQVSHTLIQYISQICGSCLESMLFSVTDKDPVYINNGKAYLSRSSKRRN